MEAGTLCGLIAWSLECWTRNQWVQGLNLIHCVAEYGVLRPLTRMLQFNVVPAYKLGRQAGTPWRSALARVSIVLWFRLLSV